MIEVAVTLWRYYLPSEHCEGWAEIVIGSNGFFAAVSDYGNYAYAWRHHGHEDARQFFLRGESDWRYFAEKLGGPNARVYDGPRTAAALREHIAEWRRTKQFTQEEARAEWQLIDDCEVEDAEAGFTRFGERTAIEEWWDFHRRRFDGALEAFCKQVLPRLARAIRADLKKEVA